MAITFTWGASWNAYPTIKLVRSLIDNEIRNIKKGVRERMEYGHDWGPFVEDGKDTGYHRPGFVEVVGQGDDIAMAAVTDPQVGALYMNTEAATKLYCFYDDGGGVDWVLIADADHGGLTGLTDHDHPQYLRQDGGDFMYGDLNMGDNVLKTPGTGSTWGDWLLFGHKEDRHAFAGHLNALPALLETAKLSLNQHSIGSDDGGEAVIPDNGGIQYITKPGGATALYFVPQIEVKLVADGEVRVIPPATLAQLFGLRNDATAQDAPWRVRVEYIE